MDSETYDQEGDQVGYQDYGVCFAAANVGLAQALSRVVGTEHSDGVLGFHPYEFLLLSDAVSL